MLRHRLREDRGAALVEFAIGAGVLFTLILMILQGSLMFQGWLTVTEAAREAARYGAPCYTRSVSPCSADQIRNYARSVALVPPSQLTNPQVQVVTTSLGGENVRWLQVSMTYRVAVIAPLVGAFIPDGFPLSASSAMRLENQE